jgi:hypothetical protein
VDRATATWDVDELAVRDRLRNELAVLADEFFRDDEGSDADRSQHVRDVEVDLHAAELDPCRRARRQPVVPDEPVHVLRVVGPLRVDGGCELLEVIAPPPFLAISAQLRTQAVALIRIRDEPAPRVVQEQPLDSLRVRRREDGTGRRLLRDPEQCGSLDPHVVHDRTDVVHS